MHRRGPLVVRRRLFLGSALRHRARPRLPRATPPAQHLSPHLVGLCRSSGAAALSHTTLADITLTFDAFEVILPNSAAKQR